MSGKRNKKQRKPQGKPTVSQRDSDNSFSKNKVDIVVPIFNGAEFVGPLISDFLNSKFETSWRLWLTDDASPDPQISRLCKAAAQDPRVKYIRNAPQVQFARTVNRGAARGQGEYICVLNTDTKTSTDDWLDVLVEELDTKPEVGLTAPLLMFYPDNDTYGPRGQVQSAGFAYNHQLLPWHRLIGWDPNHPRVNTYRDDLQGATGACLLTRRILWNQIGGMYEEYVSTFEDAEYGIRIKEAGFKVSMVPSARLYHRVGGSNAQSTLMLQRNASIFLNRVGEMVRYDEHELL